MAVASLPPLGSHWLPHTIGHLCYVPHPLNSSLCPVGLDCGKLKVGDPSRTSIVSCINLVTFWVSVTASGGYGIFLWIRFLSLDS